MKGYIYDVHLVRGTLLGELGRTEEARASLVADEHARNAHERANIRARIRELSGR